MRYPYTDLLYAFLCLRFTILLVMPHTIMIGIPYPTAKRMPMPVSISVSVGGDMDVASTTTHTGLRIIESMSMPCRILLVIVVCGYFRLCVKATIYRSRSIPSSWGFC